jgi:hypothetical protein
MKRGQAFDTMMLVISVIIAVAILGVLLFFLNQINVFGKKAGDVIPRLVKDVSQKGYGIQVEDGVEFKASETFLIKDAIGASSVSKNQIIFDCYIGSDFDPFCDPGDVEAPLDLEPPTAPTQIIARGNAKVSVAVCFGDSYAASANIGSRDLAGKYLILVGSTKENVRSQAAEMCVIS